MIVDNTTKRCRLADQAGKNLVYVEFVENAPWNRKELFDPPRYRGIGTLLMRAAIEASRQEGFKGRIGLHSLPQADAFYAKTCGMTDLGADPDPHYSPMHYFEMTARTSGGVRGERREVMRIDVTKDWCSAWPNSKPMRRSVPAWSLSIRYSTASQLLVGGAGCCLWTVRLADASRPWAQLSKSSLMKPMSMSQNFVSIEEDTRYKPEVRTVYQLANFFGATASDVAAGGWT